MSLVHNERVKLLANNLDRASSACVAVGVATPLAGWLYGVSGLDKMPWWYLLGGLAGWLTAASLLHLSRETRAERSPAMR